jgi:hypothetical protein
MSGMTTVEIPGRSRLSPDRHLRVGQVVSLDTCTGIPGRYRVVAAETVGGQVLLDLADTTTGAAMQIPAGWVGAVHRGEQ